jgi:hypothetical protein
MKWCQEGTVAYNGWVRPLSQEKLQYIFSIRAVGILETFQYNRTIPVFDVILT